MSEPTTPGRGLTRRRLFGLLGAGTAGVVAAGAAGGAIGRATADDAAAAAGPGPTDAVEFTGAHQAGIVTPAQDRLHFVAFDVTTDRREDLVEVLKAWTAAARRMTAGQDAGPVGAVAGPPYAPPDDTGETIGRAKGSGAPLGQRAEFDPVDFTKQVDGEFAVPERSHVFLAHPTNSGTAILRRGYSFVDGSDGLGRLDAGLFFIAYQRNPETGFVQVQRNLRTDAMNEYVQHTSSAVFACPPGITRDDDRGELGRLPGVERAGAADEDQFAVPVTAGDQLLRAFDRAEHAPDDDLERLAGLHL